MRGNGTSIYLDGVTRPEGLLPCPFCGREPGYLARASSHTEPGEYHALMCYCGGYASTAHHGGGTQAEVVALWNGRAPRWIPMVERLPAPGQQVLAMGADLFAGCQIVVRLVLDAGDARAWLVDAGAGLVEVQQPSHWMPLPSPPVTADTPGNAG